MAVESISDENRSVSLRVCRTCRLPKSISDFGKNAKYPDGLQTACKPCIAASTDAWRGRNPGRSAQITANWRANNPEISAQRTREYREANRDAINARRRKRNPIEPVVLHDGPILSVKEAKERGLRRFFDGKPCRNGHIAERYVGSESPCVQCIKERDIRNPEKRNKDKRRAWWRERPPIRQKRVQKATPRWVDKSALRSVYRECRRITKETGVRHDVDHIIPLKGSDVCGLHVPWNLQIITALENGRKGNHVGDCHCLRLG